MDTSENSYHISFFRPTTEAARYNRNLVILLVCIWAVAIFGFQLALLLLQKPTPEKSYTLFENSWEQVVNEEATTKNLQNFSYANLSVLGKIFLEDTERAALNNALSWSVLKLIPTDMQGLALEKIAAFNKLSEEITEISNPEYLKMKAELTDFFKPYLGMEENDVRLKLLPLELQAKDAQNIRSESIQMIPDIMSKYLIHNQSFLTDFTFIGFPFHYFYTAVFLLILFVFLCWLYCVRMDQLNKRLNLE